MRFYDRFLELCRIKGVAPSRACLDIGMSKASATKWKANPDLWPNTSTLQLLSEYFSVPLSELSGESTEEYTYYFDLVRNRVEIRLLLDCLGSASSSDVQKLRKIYEVIA